jgi:ComF family protein
VSGGVEQAIQAVVDFLVDERCHACGRAVEESSHLPIPRSSASAALAAPIRIGMRRAGIETRPLCRACCHLVVASVAPESVDGQQFSRGDGTDDASSSACTLTVWPAFETDACILSVIHALKFSRRERLARWLARAMADGLPARACESRTRHTVLVPVPMDRRSFRRRGFNQAERLASAFGALVGVPVERGALLKRRATAPQSSLGRAERVRNLRGVMSLCASVPVVGKRVVLVDDLVTTGATVHACTAVLRAAGAEEVRVACVGYRP